MKTNTDEPIGRLAAIMDFFGKLPGETTAEFAAEVKALTEEDREEFKDALVLIGYKIK